MATPLGIEQLMSIGELSVKQKQNWSVANKYTFLNRAGAELFHAKEEKNLLGSFLGGSDRAFNIDLFDAQKNVVVSLRRPYTFGQDKMEVSMGGRVVSVVRKEATFFKPVLSINDASDKPVLRVKGPFGTSGECDFELFTMSKQRIGVIRKKWRGFFAEAFTFKDCFDIQFPPDLDVRFKAAVLGTCLLIDFLYYEN